MLRALVRVALWGGVEGVCTLDAGESIPCIPTSAREDTCSTVLGCVQLQSLCPWTSHSRAAPEHGASRGPAFTPDAALGHPRRLCILRQYSEAGSSAALRSCATFGVCSRPDTGGVTTVGVDRMYDLLVERPGLEEAAEEVDSADLLEAASRCMSHPRPGRDPVEIRSRSGRDQVENRSRSPWSKRMAAPLYHNLHSTRTHTRVAAAHPHTRSRVSGEADPAP